MSTTKSPVALPIDSPAFAGVRARQAAAKLTVNAPCTTCGHLGSAHSASTGKCLKVTGTPVVGKPMTLCTCRALAVAKPAVATRK